MGPASAMGRGPRLVRQDIAARKTGEPRAPDVVLDAFRRHRIEQKRRQLEVGEIWSNPEALVFTSPPGSRSTRWAVEGLQEVGGEHRSRRLDAERTQALPPPNPPDRVRRARFSTRTQQLKAAWGSKATAGEHRNRASLQVVVHRIEVRHNETCLVVNVDRVRRPNQDERRVAQLPICQQCPEVGVV